MKADKKYDDAVYILAHRLLGFTATFHDSSPEDDHQLKEKLKKMLQEFVTNQQIRCKLTTPVSSK